LGVIGCDGNAAAVLLPCYRKPGFVVFVSQSGTTTRTISAATAAVITDIVSSVVEVYGTVKNPELVRDAVEIAKNLPDELMSACQADPDGIGFHVISGFELNEASIGPTPAHWKDADPLATADWDVLMVLLANIYGVPFGWAGQQQGRLVNNVVPSRGHEYEQADASSATLLEPHTEDAFHPGRCHFLLLAGMRNQDGVATTLSSVRDVELTPADWIELASPTLPILPDTSYELNPVVADSAPVDLAGSPAVPTVWVRDNGVCLRYDPSYTPLDDAPPQYRQAYARLTAELARKHHRVVAKPGDVLVIDNDIVVHGRDPFTARYDGTDRWLKRINVRVPGRYRPAAEDNENGYGEDVVEPFSAHRVYSEQAVSV
jgi:L-asparagine oxygenase